MLDTLRDPEWKPIECPNCTNWATFGDHHLLGFQAPTDFPINKTLPHKKGYLQYRRLDFTHLRAVAEKVHKKLLQNDWSQRQASAYMKVNCLNTDAQAEIKECVPNCVSLKEAVNSGNHRDIQVLRDDRKANPDKYTAWTPRLHGEPGLIFRNTPRLQCTICSRESPQAFSATFRNGVPGSASTRS